MKIISWNLNHRTHEKKIPDAALTFFEKYGSELIVFNEFVDGDSRDTFKRQLIEIGYSYQLSSPKKKQHDQIFIASKIETLYGDLPAPDFTVDAITNFLHVTIPGSNIEVVGMRAPAYSKASERKEYWKQMSEIISNASNRNIVFIGDINYDPFSSISEAAEEIRFVLNHQFTIPNPKGDWSFISLDGNNTSRIDHAIISESINATHAEYLTSYEGITLAGSRSGLPISDHAVLSVHISCNI